MSADSTNHSGRSKLLSHPFLLLALVLGCLFALYYFAEDSLRLLADAISENWFYAPAPFLGFGLFTVAYLFFRQTVVIRVSDTSINRYGAYDVSRRRFEKMTIENGVVNVGISHDGREVVFCRSVDFKTNVIDLGDIHKQGENYDTMLTFREVGDGLLKENRTLSKRNAELSAVPYVEGMEWGKAFVKPIFDIFEEEEKHDLAEGTEALS